MPEPESNGNCCGESSDNHRERGYRQKERNMRNIPYEEYVKGREEERCFRCGSLFGPAHHCPDRSLRVVILAEDEEEWPPPESPDLN